MAHRLRRPLADGRTCLYLTFLELLARLAALIPPPRQHRVRYFGVLAILVAVKLFDRIVSWPTVAGQGA